MRQNVVYQLEVESGLHLTLVYVLVEIRVKIKLHRDVRLRSQTIASCRTTAKHLNMPLLYSSAIKRFNVAELGGFVRTASISEREEDGL